MRTGGIWNTRPEFHRPSPKRVAWWLMKPASDLLDHEQARFAAVRKRCPELKTARALARKFADLLHKHQAQSLETWNEKAHRPEAPVELRSFADGLKEDWAVVHAVFSLGWSNGQVEGQVNRLKLIKRAMYGRANFDLLRQRFLYAG